MSESWKKMDLGGEGLQSLNMRLAREMKHRGTAYALLALFPLGLHRFYLQERWGGLALLALTALTVVLWATVGGWIALTPLLPALGLAIVDLFWIDRRVVSHNKRVRKARFLRPGYRPPEGYQGRYTDEDDAQEAGDSGRGKQRAPSFAEQEAMLRQQARQKGGTAPKR